MINTVFVDPKIKNKAFVEKFLSGFKGNVFNLDILDNNLVDELNFKETIFITEKKGSFLKNCPCSPGVISCSYHNINLIEGCTLNCNYCAIDAYLNFPAIKVFSNLDEFESQLDTYISSHSYVRIGTGELTDSLLWDKFFNYSEYLVNLFSKYDAVLEFKTKTSNIDYFLSIDPPRNVLLSWSVNTEKMISLEEKGNPTLKERLYAIKKAYLKGYKIGLHFDPVYYYPGCFEDYQELIESIFPIVKDRIGWVSIGGIRFNPKMLDILYERETNIISMEMFPSYYDSKLRLFYPLRIKLFKYIISVMRKYTDKIYLCMEPYFVWDDVNLCYKNLNKNIYDWFFL